MARTLKSAAVAAALGSMLVACGGGGGGSGGQAVAPTITSFAAAKSPITTGAATTITAAFADGAGSVDHGIGAVTSGTAVSTGALTASTSYLLTVTGAGGTATRGLTVEVVAAADQPLVTAPASATTGTAGLAASVAVQAGVTFAWTISGGTFPGGGTTATGTAVTFTAGAPGTLVLSCVATNAAGDASAAGTRSVEVVPVGAPVITSFVAARSPITSGTATTLTAVFANGTGSVDHGIGAVTSGAAVSTGALTASTSYLLTVTGAGGPATRSVTVDVAPAAIPPVVTAPASVTAGTGGLLASVPDQAGMAFAWTITGGTFTGGGSTATGRSVTFTASGPGSLVLTCTATNAAGDSSAPGSRTVTVVPAPNSTISSPLPAPPYATVGQTYSGFSVPPQPGATYQWSILNGNPTGASFTSGTTGPSADLAVGQVLGTLTLQARVTNSLGVVSTSSVSLTLVPRPNPLTFTISAPVVESGASATLTATFDTANGETAAIARGLDVSASDWIPVASGAPFGTGPLTAPTAYTLAVQNRAGTAYTWQKTVSVTGQPGSLPIGSSLVTRWRHGIVPLSTGKLLVIGGTWSDPRAELFDPAAMTFSFTGALSSPRTYSSATLLKDGKVLVVGDGWSTPDHGELYDPARGTFTPTTGALLTSRYHHTATLLNDGTVLIAGGKANATELSSAELYDPATQSFSAIGSMQIAKGKNLTAILLQSGKVMMIGFGSTQAEFYDPATRTFGQVTSLKGYRSGGVRLLDGRVLLPGGIQVTGPLQGNLSDTAEIYDPATGASTLLAARLAHPRFIGDATVLSDGRVAISSGFSGLALDTTVEIFDPSALTFTLAGGLQQAHAETAVARLVGDRLLFIGGQFRYGDTETDPEWLKLVSGFAEIYDPSGATVDTGASGTGLEAQLQGTWVSLCADQGGGTSSRFTVVFTGLALADSNFLYPNATCGGAGTRSDYPGLFTIGPAVVASLGGRSVMAHQVDLTGGGGAPPYGLNYVDTTVTPNRLYWGNGGGALDGSTPAKRPTTLDATIYAVRQ